MYEDEDGIVICHHYEDKYVIHSELFKEPGKELLKKAKEISNSIFDAFKERGFEELYTWGEDEEQHRYNLFLGYEPTGKEIKIPDYPKTVKEYVRKL